MSDKGSAYKAFESNTEGLIENFSMFTFVVKSHPKQPIISTFSGMKVQSEYNGQCSKLHNARHSACLPEQECKGRVEYVSEPLSERIPNMYISKQLSLFLWTSSSCNSCITNW